MPERTRKSPLRALKARLQLLKEMDVAQAAFDPEGGLKAVQFRPPRPPVQQPEPPRQMVVPKALRDAGFDERHMADLTEHMVYD